MLDSVSTHSASALTRIRPQLSTFNAAI